MSQLNVARLTNLLRDLLRLGRGEGPVAPEIEDAVQPVVIIEGERREHFHLAGTALRAWHTSVVPGAAANFARFRLRNPTGSGRLIVLEEFFYIDRTGGVFTMLEVRREDPFLNNDLATASGVIGTKDLRSNVLDRGAAILSFAEGNPPASDPSSLLWRSSWFGETLPHRLDVTLPPGSSIDVVQITSPSVAQKEIIFHGYERDAETSER